MIKVVSQDVWQHYKALLPTSHALYVPALPETLPYVGTIEGPFDRVAFANRWPVSSGKLQWVSPHNPNFWLPLLGSLLFLSYTLLFFGWPIGALLVAVLVWRFVRRHRGRQPVV